MKNTVKFFGLFFAFTLLISCNSETEKHTLKVGLWRGEIDIQGNTLPFTFEINKKGDDYKILLKDDNETFEIDDITVSKDSLLFTFQVFDIDIRAKIGDGVLNGVYVKNYEDDFALPFKAIHGEQSRFKTTNSSSFFDGRWAIDFVEEDGSINHAIGIFKSENGKLNGTILTTTGDYRYLEGYADDSHFALHTFDGNHAFVFKADVENDKTLKGTFWSGKDFNQPFTAVKDPNAELPDANTLTYLKEGYDKIAFSFPDLNGNMVSLEDERFKGKVVLLQIFGTWCPNCIDETKFYGKWYKENKDRGVEILGLAYEKKDDFEYASKRVKKMKTRFNIDYDYVIAGNSDKEEAAKTLPMLNHVLSFPTTMFIDKKGELRRIHTGFSGPATGKYYTQFISDFNSFVDELLAE